MRRMTRSQLIASTLVLLQQAGHAGLQGFAVLRRRPYFRPQLRPTSHSRPHISLPAWQSRYSLTAPGAKCCLYKSLHRCVLRTYLLRGNSYHSIWSRSIMVSQRTDTRIDFIPIRYISRAEVAQLGVVTASATPHTLAAIEPEKVVHTGRTRGLYAPPSCCTLCFKRLQCIQHLPVTKHVVERSHRVSPPIRPAVLLRVYRRPPVLYTGTPTRPPASSSISRDNSAPVRSPPAGEKLRHAVNRYVYELTESIRHTESRDDRRKSYNCELAPWAPREKCLHLCFKIVRVAILNLTPKEIRVLAV